jgi:hypothetical protein
LALQNQVMSLVDALGLVLGALLLGYIIGRESRQSDNSELEKINSALDRLTTELCGDYKRRAAVDKMLEFGIKLDPEETVIESGKLGSLTSATHAIAFHLHHLNQTLKGDARQNVAIVENEDKPR